VILATLAWLDTGCTIMHPRYAPELGRRWPECLRLVVIPGTVKTETKNYLTDEYFRDESKGQSFAQLLSDSTGEVLREVAGREVRHAGEAIDALGSDPVRARAVADEMLLHARQWMAKDPGYDDAVLHGLATDPGVLPYELRRGFDAVVVVGGRAKYESQHETYERYAEIVVRNVIAVPLLLASPFIPFALPASMAIILGGQGGYWRSAPNVSYFEVAVFDTKTGRLLYTNDWWATQPIVEVDDFNQVAKDLLKKLVRVRAGDEGPLGKKPASF
jgi:hypothetical protein